MLYQQMLDKAKHGKSPIEKPNLNGASPMSLHKEQMLVTKKNRF